MKENFHGRISNEVTETGRRVKGTGRNGRERGGMSHALKAFQRGFTHRCLHGVPTISVKGGMLKTMLP